MERGKRGFCVRLTDVYIFVMLLVFPLFTGVRGYAQLTLSKYLFFVCATCSWLLLLAGCGIYSLIKRKNILIYPHAPSAVIIMFMVICSLSAIFSPYRDSVFIGAGRYDGLASILLYGGIFLGCARFARPSLAHAAALAVSCTICCVIAVFQLLNMDFLGLFPSGMSYYDHGTLYSGEFLGTIGNTNLLSAFLCLCIPLFCCLFVAGERAKTPVFVLPAFLAVLVMTASGVSGGALALCVCTLLAIPAMVTTRQRLYRALSLLSVLALAVYIGGSFGCRYEDGSCSFYFDWLRLLPVLLVSPAAMVVCILLKRLDAPRLGRQGFRRLFVAVEAILIAAGLAVVYFWPWQSGTLYELSSLLHGHIDDSFGSSRIAIWKNVLALFPERPLLGGGPDTLALRLDMHFSRYVPETGKTLSVYVDNAHNEYLGLLVNTGALSLAAYLACMGLTLKRLVTGRAGQLVTALGLGLICYWIQAFFGLGLCITAPLMWIFWGMVCSYNNEGTNCLDEQENQKDSDCDNSGCGSDSGCGHNNGALHGRQEQ